MENNALRDLTRASSRDLLGNSPDQWPSDLFDIESDSSGNITITPRSGVTLAGGGPATGMILGFGNTTAPSGYLSCDGSAVSRTTYAALFTAIETKWGVGDGSTTFNVPDGRGATLRGTGSHGSATMADGNPFTGPAVGATENDQMQGHKHSVDPPSHRHSIDIGANIGGSKVRQSTTKTGTGYTGYYNFAAFDSAVPKTDGTNGTPRAGDETRPFAAGVLWCIKT